MAQEVEVKIKFTGATQAKAEVSKITGVMKDLENSVGRSQNTLGIKGVAIGTFLGTSIANGLSSAIGLVESTISSLASGALNVLKDSIGQAADLQQIRLSFETMLGSGEKAKQLLEDLNAFALQTPFNLTGLEEQTQRLLAYGLVQEDIIPTLNDLGNIAAGVGREKLPFLITALGQVRAKTVLSGEELKQFTETGVPLIEELAKVTGYSVAQIVDNTKDLGIGYDSVREALKRLSNDGGKFDGLMQKQSKTLLGVSSNFEDLRDNMLKMVGGITKGGDLIEGGLLDTLQKQATELFKTLQTPEMQQKLNDIGVKLGQSFGKFAEVWIPKIIEKLPGLIDKAVEFVGKIKFEDIQKTAEDFINTLKTVRDIFEVAGRAIEIMFLGLKDGIMGVITGFEIARLRVESFFASLTGDQETANLNTQKIAALQNEYNLQVADSMIKVAELDDKINATQGRHTNLTAEAKRYREELLKANGLASEMYSTVGGTSYQASQLAGHLQSISNLTYGGVSIPDKFVYGGSSRNMATGGIVGGNSTRGDKINTNLNSGEMVLNRNDQNALFNFIKSLGRPQQVINANFNGNNNSNPRQQMNSFTELLTQM